MVAVELSDVVFADDSIPAVFGVTEVSGLQPIITILLTDDPFSSRLLESPCGLFK